MVHALRHTYLTHPEELREKKVRALAGWMHG